MRHFRLFCQSGNGFSKRHNFLLFRAQAADCYRLVRLFLGTDNHNDRDFLDRVFANLIVDFFGADIVANAVAALEKYPAPIIMIDMGTATTISYISAKHTYEGGLMFPGVRLSLDALSDHTAQLPDVALQHPKQLIGKNTEDCMRSGIVYGTAGMLDGIIDRIRDMLGEDEHPSIIATGSNAPVIVRYCRNRIVYDKYLLMEGLWNIYQRNK